MISENKSDLITFLLKIHLWFLTALGIKSKLALPTFTALIMTKIILSTYLFNPSSSEGQLQEGRGCVSLHHCSPRCLECCLTHTQGPLTHSTRKP